MAIDGWYLATPVGALALAGTLTCALMLLEVWLARADRPSKAAFEPEGIPWPGGPVEVWQSIAAGPPLERPRNPPRWATFEDYLALVESPQRKAAVAGALGVVAGALLGAALWLVPPTPTSTWQHVLVVVLPMLALVQVVLGVWVWWPPRRHALLRSQYGRVQELGVLCDVHDAGLEIVRSADDGAIRTRLLVAAGTPDAQAARLAAAVQAWAARVAAADAMPALVEAWGVRHAVRTEDVFGTGADGGFLLESSHEPGGWAILIEMNAVNGDSSRYRWVEKIFVRGLDPLRSAVQQPPR